MRIKQNLILLLALASLTACAHHNNHLPQPQPQLQVNNKIHTIQSHYNFEETITRLQEAISSKQMTIFTIIDHQAAAQQNDLHMQPATVIIFGTPKAGTPLMIKDPAFALQLPLRVLVTELEGNVQVIFNDTHALINGTKIDYADVSNSLANAEKLIRATVTK